MLVAVVATVAEDLFSYFLGKEPVRPLLRYSSPPHEKRSFFFVVCVYLFFLNSHASLLRSLKSEDDQVERILRSKKKPTTHATTLKRGQTVTPREGMFFFILPSRTLFFVILVLPPTGQLINLQHDAIAVLISVCVISN